MTTTTQQAQANISINRNPINNSDRRGSIDDWLVAKKQAAARRRLLDDITAKLQTTTSVDILNSHDSLVLEHVASLLVSCTKLQKLFLLRGLSRKGATALRQALAGTTSLKVLKILQNDSHEEEALLMLLQGKEWSAAKNVVGGAAIDDVTSTTATTTNSNTATNNKGGLVGNQSITDLVINNCPLRQPETASALVQAVTSPYNVLIRLSLVDIPTLGQHAALLAPVLRHGAAGLTNVQILRCGIDATGAAALASALGMPPQRITTPTTAASSLEYLSLEGNPIGDDGATALAHALRHNQTLTHLMLYRNCHIGNTGAMALSHMLRHHNTTLQALDLSGNPDIRIRGKEALVEALQQNPTLVSVGMRVTHRHPLRPTVVEQLGDLMHINAIRQQWNSHRQQQHGDLPRGRSQSRLPTRKTRPHGLSLATTQSKDRLHNHNCNTTSGLSLLSSSILPHYLAKVAVKPSVLYLSLQENVDMILPYLQSKNAKDTNPYL